MSTFTNYYIQIQSDTVSLQRDNRSKHYNSYFNFNLFGNGLLTDPIRDLKGTLPTKAKIRTRDVFIYPKR